MKKLTFLGFIYILVLFVLLTNSCKKQDVYRVMKISTDTIANVSDTSALLFGTIIDAGDGIVQHGHCWSTNENPTIADNFVNNGSTSETGEFTSTLRALTPGAVYYVRAYATGDNETIYGDQKFFSSGKGLPKLAINQITNIGKASATCEVEITSDGGEAILTKGLVWGTNSNPVIGYSDGLSSEEGSETLFNSDIISVSPEATIYVRAYASNENGIAYSEQEEITMQAAESGDYIWARNYGKFNDDMAEKIWVDDSENVYLTGTFKSESITFGEFTLTNTGEDDVFIAKFDTDGNVLWATSAVGAGKDFVKGICGDNAGNIYIMGSSGSIAFETTEVNSFGSYIAKYTSTGVLVWANGYTNGCDGIDCDASNIYMTGLGDPANFDAKKKHNTKAVGFGDIYLAKLNSSGVKTWAVNLGETTFGTDLYLYHDVCVDPSGNVYATGNFNSNLENGEVVPYLSSTGGAEIYLAKFNSSGTYQWARQGLGAGDDYAISICSSPMGDIYLTGNFTGNGLTFGALPALNNSGQTDLFAAKYSDAGVAIWAKNYGGADYDYGTDITTDAAGNIFLSGSFSSSEIIFDAETLTSRGESDVLVAKFLSSGDVDWAQSAGSLLYDEGKSIGAEGNNVYFAGSVEGPVVYFDYFELSYLGLKDIFVSKIRQ